MRQTGRTTRIVNFVVDQLFSVSECIATDHTAFEFETATQSNLRHFIDMVKNKVYQGFPNQPYVVEHKFIKVEGKWMVHFKMKLKTNKEI